MTVLIITLMIITVVMTYALCKSSNMADQLADKLMSEAQIKGIGR